MEVSCLLIYVIFRCIPENMKQIIEINQKLSITEENYI